MLYKHPNKFTNKPSFKKELGEATITGYHSYKLTMGSIHPIGNRKKIAKYNLLKSFLWDEVSGKTVIDLGAATGIFSITAAQHKAKKVIAVDIDKHHLQVLKNAIKFSNLKNVKIIRQNAQDFKQKGDITLVLALIHWIYSCSSSFGDFDSIMKWLKSITSETIILEWIAPNDANIELFHHLDYNKESIHEKYNKTNFINSLKKHFTSFELIGHSSPTREIYKITV